MESLAWRSVERALRDLQNDIEDIDSFTDPEAKRRHVRWAQDDCSRLSGLLEDLAPDV